MTKLMITFFKCQRFGSNSYYFISVEIDGSEFFNDIAIKVEKKKFFSKFHDPHETWIFRVNVHLITVIFQLEVGNLLKKYIKHRGQQFHTNSMSNCRTQTKSHRKAWVYKYIVKHFSCQIQIKPVRFSKRFDRAETCFWKMSDFWGKNVLNVFFLKITSKSGFQ